MTNVSAPSMLHARATAKWPFRSKIRTGQLDDGRHSDARCSCLPGEKDSTMKRLAPGSIATYTDAPAVSTAKPWPRPVHPNPNPTMHPHRGLVPSLFTTELALLLLSLIHI
eukprot:TRINITY_DN9542_c0_g1_i7.p1 TRINITY_DN9542_c0_g1~~TRINITY_DN9542_c0_g1_i7.p1  ORF type:complete len:111 (-),score=8.36 TRINITY_DN9542_c0_g1_i7:117-449(-)